MISVVLATLAFFPMVLSPFVAYGAYREGDTKLATRSAGVFLISALVFFAAPKANFSGEYGRCATEWDGFSNPSYCSD